MLVVLVAGAAVVQAPERPSQPVSLIVAGQWRGVTVVGNPPCPENVPDCLSLNVIADVRLGNVRTLAGPRVPTVMTARFEFHADPARGAQQVLLVRRSAVDHGRFDAINLGRVLRGRPICVARDALTANSITVPRRAQLTGDMVCFQL